MSEPTNRDALLKNMNAGRAGTPCATEYGTEASELYGIAIKSLNRIAFFAYFFASARSPCACQRC